MKKQRFRSLPLYETTSYDIDPQNGIIRGIVLANQGLNKNNTYFSERFLNQLLQAGQKAQTEKGGIKCRFGHPNMCSSSLGTFVGVYRDFYLKDGNLYGDLHFSDLSKKATERGVSLFDYIFEMAQKHQKFFGNSIVIYANPFEEVVIEDDQEQTYFGHDLIEWSGSDLVDDPAATNSLFTQNIDLGATITDFFDQNPQLFDLIEKHPQLINDFGQRYAHYFNKKHNKNSNMIKNVFQKLGRIAQGKYDVDMTLANGEIITIETDEQQPKTGDPVTDKDGNTLPDGQYLLADERTLVVKEGKVEEIKEKSSEENPENQDNTQEEEFKALNQKLFQIENALKQAQKERETLAQGIYQLTTLFQSFAKSQQSSYQSQENTGESFSNNTKEESFLEKMKKRQQEYKTN